MRVSSAFALAFVASAASAQSFGRFGYVSEASLPGWRVDRAGFNASAAGSARFKFAAPCAEWRPAETTAMRQTVVLGRHVPGLPDRAILPLDAPGFSLRFREGIELIVDSADPPFLSWGEGSVGDGVPTPPVRWILVSFRTPQPPVLLGFWGGEGSLVVEGSPGKWRIHSADPFSGWVWFVQPTGDDAIASGGASGLGRLVAMAKEHESVWSSPMPAFVARKVESDDRSVTGIWRYDRPGALIPAAALMASLGGAPCRVASPHRFLPGRADDGPLAIATTAEIRIRFAARVVPAGRFIAGEVPDSPEWTGAVGTTFEDVVSTALRLLAARSTSDGRKHAEQAINQYLRGAKYTLEPWTRLRSPFTQDGTGLESLAAYALLAESLRVAQPATDLNPLMSTVARKVDWRTWQPWGLGAVPRRRVAAVAAIAGAFSSVPSRRLEAAMLQAGLSAERGAERARMQREGLPGQPQLLEPLEGLRTALYSLDSSAEPDALASALFSPLRSDNRRPVRLVAASGGQPLLTWWNYDALTGSLALFAPHGMSLGRFTPNLERAMLTRAESLLILQFKPKDAGLCAVGVTWPDALPTIPALPPQPAYSETVR